MEKWRNREREKERQRGRRVGSTSELVSVGYGQREEAIDVGELRRVEFGSDGLLTGPQRLHHDARLGLIVGGHRPACPMALT